MKFYGTIDKAEKQDDGTMIVSGFASSEAVDSDGEIIKSDAMKAAIPDYMKFANVREMHKSDTASGVVLEMAVQDDGRTWVKTHIVGAEACKKVEHKVYKGFSIGGKVLSRDPSDAKVIKSIKLNEISLVDRPANPEAVFTFAKVDDADDVKLEDVKKVDDQIVDVNKKVEEVKKDDVKKGMYGVSYLASILDSIQGLMQSAEWEADMEGDNSPMPAQLKEWLKQGGALLKDMVVEEVSEMVGDDEIDVEIVQLADKAKNLMKVACTADDADKFCKGLDGLMTRNLDMLVKSGARNSKADQTKINDIHDAAVGLGADCSASKAAGNADLAKRAHTEINEIAKVLGIAEGGEAPLEKVKSLVADNEELGKVCEQLAEKVKKFEALPKPPKAALKVVEKGDDAVLSDVKKQAPAENAVDAIKKVWGGQQ